MAKEFEDVMLHMIKTFVENAEEYNNIYNETVFQLYRFIY